MDRNVFDRVGRKRLGIRERRIEIVKAIAIITLSHGKGATVTAIANEMGLTPSTHLRKIIDIMLADGYIGRWQYMNGRGQVVSKYTVMTIIQEGCQLPWKCDARQHCYMLENLKVCVGRVAHD